MRRRKGQEQADIASRKLSKDRELSGEFLEGTESAITSIEPTASSGFGEAWAQRGDDVREQSFDSAIDVGQDDSEVRNLDRSRLGTYLGVAASLIGIGAVAFFATQFATDPDSSLGARASDDADRNVIRSPLAEREYTAASGPLSLRTTDALTEVFVDGGSTGNSEILLEGGGFDQVSQGAIVAAPVFWAGRTHMVVIGDVPLLADDACVITSLVTAELEVVDVAAAGACDEAFDATGDRLACSAENAILVEVWPLNPDAVTEPRLVSGVRTRISRTINEDVISRRGSLDVTNAGGVTPLVTASSTLEGTPGDSVTFTAGELSAECTLLDRSDVDIRLLPG